MTEFYSPAPCFGPIQMALAYHNMRDVDVAVDAFKNLLELDPFRLENMDSYSNLLYVKAVR